jgi:hypothetical protein
MSKRQAAVEVIKVLESKRIVVLISLASTFILGLLGRFSLVFGIVGIGLFASYYIFEFWRLMRKATYLKRYYGV